MCFGSKLKGEHSTAGLNNDDSYLNSRPVDSKPQKSNNSKMPTDNGQSSSNGSYPNQHSSASEYPPPSGPPPSHDFYAPPPGPPPTQQPYHDWQTAVPDTSLLPPPPSMGNQRSATNNATEAEAEQGKGWCEANPLYGPVQLNPQSQRALETGEIGVVAPRSLKGTLERTRPGVWKGKTRAGCPDSCILSTVPLYSVYSHSPLQTNMSKTIYYEVRIASDNRREVSLALGFSAPPYPTFRLPGWHRGSLAVHGDDGSKYINDMWGGRDFTQPFRAGETIGIGMTFTRNDLNAPPAYVDAPGQARTTVQKPIGVEVFLTRDGKKAGGWNLHEEGDAEEDLPVTGLEGFHDLLASDSDRMPSLAFWKKKDKKSAPNVTFNYLGQIGQVVHNQHSHQQFPPAYPMYPRINQIDTPVQQTHYTPQPIYNPPPTNYDASLPPQLSMVISEPPSTSQLPPPPQPSKVIASAGWCTECANIPMSLFTIIDDTVYTLKPNLGALDTSAQNGCPFCSLMLSYIVPKIKEPQMETYPISIYQAKAIQRAMLGPAWRAVKYRPGAVFNVEFVISNQVESETGIFSWFPKNPVTGNRMLSGSNGIRACFPGGEEAPRANVSTRNDAPSSYAFGKHFLQKCRQEHNICWRSQDFTLPLPSRLVDVGNDDHSMRIVSTEGYAKSDMPYLCLSYCWGTKLSANLVLTKTTNLHARHLKLEHRDLSKTLQDAIVATRNLGYRYIWIDALCICQDSTEDWHSVSSKMGDIYKNSELTIAASAAADSTEGIFRTRDESLTRRVTLQWHEDRNVQVIVSPAEHVPAPEREPLYKRAWCFQETILSPRVLYYTQGELMFECERLKVTESDWEFDRFQKSSPEPGEIERWRYRRLNGDIEGVEEIYYDQWTPFVEKYSRRLLTKEADRLPAISAIARNVIMAKVHEENPNDAYLGGIFRGDLIKSLTWMKHDEESLEMKRPKSYIAPSWSWASVTGGVRFTRIPLRPDLISIIESETTPVNPNDSFGQLSRGHLRVDGHLKLVANAGRITDSNIPLSTKLIRLPSPFTEKDLITAVANLPPRIGLRDGGSTIGQMYFDDIDDEIIQDIYCLYLRPETKESQMELSTSEAIKVLPLAHGAIFLALCKVEAREGGVFRRVGIGAMFDPEWFEDVSRQALKII